MILYINSSDKEKVILFVESGGMEIARAVFDARYRQAEKLLPAIDKLLAGGKKMVLGDIKEIQVANYGQSFTALRIGVVTANVLGYALGVPVVGGENLEDITARARQVSQKAEQKNKKTKGDFDVVRPVYSREPNITKHGE